MRGMSPGKRLTCRYQGSNLGCEWKLAFSSTGLSSPVNQQLILIVDQPSVKLSGHYPSNVIFPRFEAYGVPWNLSKGDEDVCRKPFLTFVGMSLDDEGVLLGLDQSAQ